MEAMAALSLACNVITLITFGRDLLQTYSQLKTNGSPECDLRQKIQVLNSHATELRTRSHEFDPVKSESTGPGDPDQIRARETLQRIALKLSKDTAQLEKLLDKLASGGPQASRMTRFKVSVSYRFEYRKQIANIEAELKDTQDCLNNEFLSRVCSSSQASYALTKAKLGHVHGDLKVFVARWADGQRDLNRLIALETIEVKKHIDMRTEEIRDDIFNARSEAQVESRRVALLKTLWFPDINSRENKIMSADHDTQDWIFGEDSLLPKWLESEDSVFWISGKPGSGKSTVMKHIIHYKKTTDLLKQWQPDLVILRFFLIEIGSSPLQRTVHGCLRTLLHQLLSGHPQMLDSLIDTDPKIATKSAEGDWSEQELEETLLDLLRNLESPSACCIFLDGLDESDSSWEKRNFTRVTKQLSEIPRVKLCVSSRPENVFQSGLAEFPKLWVHDINQAGIRALVDSTLRPYWDASEQSEVESYQRFVNILTRKSEGIFLWVHLALKTILDGIDNLDEWSVLLSRAEEVQEGTYSLYKQIYARNSTDSVFYAKEAAQLFWHQLYGGQLFCNYFRSKYGLSEFEGPIALSIILAIDSSSKSELERLVTHNTNLTKAQLSNIHRRFERWLFSRSAGLLELVRDRRGNDLATVRFIHRSVKEFLVHTSEGREILGHDQRTEARRWRDAIKTGFDLALFSRHLPSEWRPDYHYEYQTQWMFESLKGITIALENSTECDPAEWAEFLSSVPALLDTIFDQLSLLGLRASSSGAFFETKQWQLRYLQLPPRCRSLALYYYCIQFMKLSKQWYYYSGSMRHITTKFIQFHGLSVDSLDEVLKASMWRAIESALTWMVDNGADPGCRIPLAGPEVPESVRIANASSALEFIMMNARDTLKGGEDGFPPELLLWPELLKCIDLLRFTGGSDILPLTSLPFVLAEAYRNHKEKRAEELGEEEYDEDGKRLLVAWVPDEMGFDMTRPDKTHRELGRMNGALVYRLLLAMAAKDRHAQKKCSAEIKEKFKESGQSLVRVKVRDFHIVLPGSEATMLLNRSSMAG